MFPAGHDLFCLPQTDALLRLGSVLEIIPHAPFGMHILRI